MADELRYEVCPETGIGCILVGQGSGVMKLDLMPDEAVSLRELAQAGDLAGVRGLLASIDSEVESLLGDAGLDALVKELG